MKKILIILVAVLFITTMTILILQARQDYFNEWEKAEDEIVLEAENNVIKVDGLLKPFYRICLEDSCYISNEVIYSDEYGDGVHILLTKQEKNFFKDMLTTILGGKEANDYPLYYATFYVGD